MRFQNYRVVCVTALVAVALLGLGIGARPVRAQAPPASAGPVSPALIEDLVAAYRILAKEGILDAFGHVSIRHPGNPNRYVMARAVAPALVTADDMMEFDLDSNAVNPKAGTATNERFIHGEIYKVRPDVKAVVHSHSPTVVPFSVTNVPMRPVLHTASFLYVGVPVFEVRDAGGPYTTIQISNGMLGKALAAKLGDKPVVLLRGHGNAVVAPDIQTVVRYTYYTEVNAKMQVIALGLGGPVNYVSREEGETREKSPIPFERAWELWKKDALGR